MAILIATPTQPADAWLRAFKRHAPKLDTRVWPDCGNPDDVTFIVAWETPPGFYTPFPNLRCIASLGAGVDHLMKDPELPASVPVTRVIDPSMSEQMGEYVLLHVLGFTRHSRLFVRDAANEVWQPRIPLRAVDTTVGIMGLGQLGSDAAEKLQWLGFPVIGWRRTACQIGDIQTFWGPEGLAEFLGASRVLVCMLPLTPATAGILDADLFAQLPKGAYVINVARGAHLVEADLLDALDREHLAGACLDVLQTEPPPTGHPLWNHPKVTLTPHIASITNPKAVVPQMVADYEAVMAGGQPRHCVDMDRGY